MTEKRNCTYYPPKESQAMWRKPLNDAEMLNLCGIDSSRLENAVHMQYFLNGGDTFGVVVIRNGYLVREFYTENALEQTTYDIFSCTKSFASMAIGCMIEDIKRTGKGEVTLDSKAYDYIPQGHPLTDERKKDITIRQLLSMSSGLIGEGNGVIGMGVSSGDGHFEYALGKIKNRFGKTSAVLLSDPGKSWDYSDANYVHLALLFKNITGLDMHEYMKTEVFDKIGLEYFYWDLQGGAGNIGPHTNGHSGFHVNARGLARCGYLLLNNGVWEGRQVVPEWWIREATRPSQPYNESYGLGFWVNENGNCLPGLPKDTYFMKGYRGNRCYVVPSLNLVVARTASGPSNWDDTIMLGGIIRSIVTK